MRFTSLLVGVGDRRQETGDNPPARPSQEGKTGRTGNEREGRIQQLIINNYNYFSKENGID
ncbi:MAG: hypothetical protein F6K24_19560 [Okeania sp. SIO2D1]|nr:hypothetical protein [Okeania sp. SIO2D1]